jgi:hypothetical protein
MKEQGNGTGPGVRPTTDEERTPHGGREQGGICPEKATCQGHVQVCVIDRHMDMFAPVMASNDTGETPVGRACVGSCVATEVEPRRKPGS